MFKKRKNPSESGAEMSFLDHLEALRWHLVRSVVAIFAVSIVAFFFKELLFDGIIFAPKKPDFWTYRMLCMLSDKFNLDMCIKEIHFNLISTELAAQFTLHMWVAFLAGVIISFPYIVWEFWSFIRPALHDNERRNARGIVFYTSFLFTLGVLFGYYIITPMSINFLGNYRVSADVTNMISMDSYISTVTILTLATGIVFELPIAIYFLTRIGLVTPAFLRKYRKHAVIIILIVGGIITPSPDITSQLLVSFPLYLLYEISIFVSALVLKNKNDN